MLKILKNIYIISKKKRIFIISLEKYRFSKTIVASKQYVNTFGKGERNFTKIIKQNGTIHPCIFSYP